MKKVERIKVKEREIIDKSYLNIKIKYIKEPIIFMKQKNSYQKSREYFLNYQRQNKKPRKYPFCAICGQENNKRYNKVCSTFCSKTLRRITVQNCLRNY